MMRALSLLVLLGFLILPAYGLPGVKTFNYSTYINVSGEPVIVGEVINDGNEPVKSVHVKANFLDPTGQILDSGSTVVAIELIPPGQRAPFKVVGSIQYALNVKSFELQVVDFTKGESKPAKLEIVNAEDKSDGFKISISGEIRNAGDKTATMPKVHGTFYDDSNRVITFASANTDSEVIAPGEIVSFTLETRERVSSISGYTLYAESEQFSTAPFGLRSISSSVAASNRVSVSALTLVDQQGSGVGKLAPNERAWIKSDLKNRQSMEQEFIYIVQIKDSEGFPVELKWINGILEPNMSISQSVSWTPEEEGIYFAEVFVWNSMEDPIPLSTSIKTVILFVKT